MALVIFEPARSGPTAAAPLQVNAPDGGSLADLCDDVQANVPFSCRSASCGTCRIAVMDGSDELLPAEDEELDVLDAFRQAPPHYRLACCAKLKPGTGRLRIRPVRDDE
jgi:2Fe-2S ferredoxin